MDAIPLTGTVVAVTGGGRGIGEATLRAFAEAGAIVAAGDLDELSARAVVAPLGGEGYELDVRSAASFSRFLSRVSSDLGPLGALVNNAGIMPLGKFSTEADELTEAVIDVNLRGVINGTKLALPGMLDRRRGHIVNVVSYLGKLPAGGAATYCATKFGALGFSESLSDELAGSGVTVSAVLPSAVRTGLTAGVKLGGWLPTVDPERIAAEIVKSCRTRRPVIRVPRWMRAYEVIAAFAPSRPLSAGRIRLARERIEGLDPSARAGYDERVGLLLVDGNGVGEGERVR